MFSEPLKVYYTDSFMGHWPVGAARCLIVAIDKRRAKRLLRRRMIESGLGDQFEKALEGLQLVTTTWERVVNFSSGDY